MTGRPLAAIIALCTAWLAFRSGESVSVLRIAAPRGPGHQWGAYDQPRVVVRWHDGDTGNLAYAESITTLDANR